MDNILTYYRGEGNYLAVNMGKDSLYTKLPDDTPHININTKGVLFIRDTTDNLVNILKSPYKKIYKDKEQDAETAVALWSIIRDGFGKMFTNGEIMDLGQDEVYHYNLSKLIVTMSEKGVYDFDFAYRVIGWRNKELMKISPQSPEFDSEIELMKTFRTSKAEKKTTD